MAEFSWEAPIAKPRDAVKFRNHHGKVVSGTISRVETWYADDLAARHAYAIYQNDTSKRRQQWVGADEILEVT